MHLLSVKERVEVKEKNTKLYLCKKLWEILRDLERIPAVRRDVGERNIKIVKLSEFDAFIEGISDFTHILRECFLRLIFVTRSKISDYAISSLFD